MGTVLRIADPLTTVTHYCGVMVLHGLRVTRMSNVRQAMQRTQMTFIVVVMKLRCQEEDGWTDRQKGLSSGTGKL